MMRSTLHKIVVTLLLASASGLVHAQDTDIYLTPANITRDDSPDVLIILDNSGSMGDTVSSSKKPYDPTVNYYSLSGSPQITTGRVYWSTNGSPPASNTSQWFSSTNNNCESSKVTLATGGGVYSGVRVLEFKPSGSGKGWRALQSGDNYVVDCEADNGATDPNGYVKSGSINPFAAYTTTSSQQINWATITSIPTLYSANYMNWYYNNSAANQITTTKMSIAQNAVDGIIDANQNLRIGLMVFNYGGTNDSNQTDTHGGRVVMKVDNMTDARRTQMKSIVNSVTASTWTPLSETLWEALQYFAGNNVDYGDNDPSATPARDTTAESGGKYISPLRYACQKGFIILVTDGDPTYDTAANAKIAALPGIGTTFSGSRLDELAGWMNTHDVNSTLSGNQTLVTYTIGFDTGSISSTGKQLLQDTATKGGGSYQVATNADELTNSLQAAITDLTTQTSSFVAPALSVNAFNRLYNRDDVYFAMFKPSDTVQWDGNVKKFSLNATGDIIDANGTLAIDTTTQRIKDSATSAWGSTVDGGTVTAGGVGAQMPAPNQRIVYTYLGSYSGLSSTSPATLTAISTSSSNSFRTAMVTDPTKLGLTSSATSTDVDALINWMLGADSYDKDGNASTTTRWAVGDPLHSRPTAITYGGTDTAPVIKLFVATNDGAIRMYNDKTGAEEWAFVPAEALSTQYALSQDAPGIHPHLLDGTPTFWLIDNNNNGIIEPSNGDKLYMFVGQRRGGRNIYAFDITPTSTLTNPATSGGVVPKLIWAIRGGIDSGYLSLGQTWSRPSLARIRYACTGSTCNAGDSQSTYVLAFGGGYDPNEDNSIFSATGDTMGNAIYLTDPLSGQRIWWASGSADSAGNSPDLTVSGMIFSIPSDLTLVDTNGDGSVDRVFVGDMSGQIWRIDLSSTIKTNTNAGSTGYRFADLACPTGTRPACSGTAPQDRRKFFYPPEYAQVADSNFSTTKNYDILAIGSGDREDPLDLLTASTTPTGPVHNQLYMLRDYTITTGPVSTVPAAITLSDLYDDTADVFENQNSTGYSSAVTSIKAKKGWYVNLTDTSGNWVGEKVLARAVIFGGVVYFTSYVPPSVATSTQTCRADEGLGQLHAMHILDATANYDYSGNGSIGAEDRTAAVGGGIPSQLVIVIRQTGVSGLIGTSGGANKPSGINPSLPRQRVYWSEE